MSPYHASCEGPLTVKVPMVCIWDNVWRIMSKGLLATNTFRKGSYGPYLGEEV